MDSAPKGPFYVMLDFEQSVAECLTLEEARSTGQSLCDQEVLPCTFSISDSEGAHVEDIVRSDGRDLSAQIRAFNDRFGRGQK